jgi:hypothetical protein
MSTVTKPSDPVTADVLARLVWIREAIELGDYAIAHDVIVDLECDLAAEREAK